MCVYVCVCVCVFFLGGEEGTKFGPNFRRFFVCKFGKLRNISTSTSRPTLRVERPPLLYSKTASSQTVRHNREEILEYFPKK